MESAAINPSTSTQAEEVLKDLQLIHCLYLQGKCLGPIPRLLPSQEPCMLERACLDDYSTSGKRRFCSLFKLSERSSSLMIPKILQQPNDGSPSKPFFDNPSLGVETVLRTVFRAKGKLPGSLSRVFTGWIACPSDANHDALAFTAGHCFTSQKLSLTYAENNSLDFGKDHNFSELLGCFGTDVGNAEFSSFGFTCSSKPLVIVTDNEDLALFAVTDRSEKINHFLLPCSAALECADNKKFMATFSYPCTQSFVLEAYEELVEAKCDHGIQDLYSFLGLDNVALYDLLSETFHAFSNGSLVCSPGALGMADGVHCYYKCSTVRGSSGAPVIPTHLSGYSVGTHYGAKQNEDYNVATSTDSPAYVTIYAQFALPRLPPKGSKFWNGWNLKPFERWLKLHQLAWEEACTGSSLTHSIGCKLERSAAAFSGWPSWHTASAAFSGWPSCYKRALRPTSSCTGPSSFDASKASQHWSRQNVSSERKIKWESSCISEDVVATPPPTIRVPSVDSFGLYIHNSSSCTGPSCFDASKASQHWSGQNLSNGRKIKWESGCISEDVVATPSPTIQVPSVDSFGLYIQT